MNALSQARNILAQALSMHERDLPENPRIGSIEQWDSLAHTRIFLGLEERIGKPLDPQEAVAIESLADIAKVIERHG